MAIRAVVDTSNLRLSAERSEIQASTSYEKPHVSVQSAFVQVSPNYTKPDAAPMYVAADMQDLFLEYEPKNKRFSETYLLSELTVIASTKSFNDEVQTADEATKVFGRGKHEAVTAEDEAHQIYTKVNAELIPFVDYQAKDLTKNSAELIALYELTSLDIATSKHSDISELADYIETTTAFNRTFYDAFGLDDYASIDKDFVGSKGNIFGVSDTHDFEYLKSASDSISSTDYNSVSMNANKSDSLSFSETTHRINTKGIYDSSALSDESAFELRQFKEDVFSTVDSTFVDVDKLQTDLFSVSDLVSRQVQFNRQPNETLSLDETVGKNVGAAKNDQLGVTDLFNRTVAFGRHFNEQATLTELLGKDTVLGKDDSFSTNDALSRFVEFNRVNSDDVSTSDVAISHFTKPISDNAMLADVVSQTRTYNRFFSDWFTLDDIASVDKNVIGNKTNVFGFADIHSCLVAKEVTDTVGFLETVEITRRSTAGFNTDSFNTALFN